MRLNPVSRYRSEESLNALTAALGLGFAIGGAYLLVTRCSSISDLCHQRAWLLYAVTLVGLYVASTCYHCSHHPQVRHFFRIVDHSCIYLFIAGSYTPFMLVSVHGTVGWVFFFAIWTMALIGVFCKTFYFRQFQRFSTVSYLIMGWLGLLAIRYIAEALPPAGFILVLAGGVAYTIGAGFFRWRTLPYHHAIWHVCVIAGSVCHFFAVLEYSVT